MLFLRLNHDSNTIIELTKRMNKGGETKKRDNYERGATVVEFAVIVLILFLIFIGILEFAFIFYQRHFVENAAREGMRVGIRANNYETFSGATGCTDNLDRFCAVDMAVRSYLATIYQTADISSIEVERVDAKSLKVTVQVINFFPQLLSGFVPGFASQNIFSYSITGRYEDPDEYDNGV